MQASPIHYTIQITYITITSGTCTYPIPLPPRTILILTQHLRASCISYAFSRHTHIYPALQQCNANLPPTRCSGWFLNLFSPLAAFILACSKTFTKKPVCPPPLLSSLTPSDLSSLAAFILSLSKAFVKPNSGFKLPQWASSPLTKLSSLAKSLRASNA